MRNKWVIKERIKRDLIDDILTKRNVSDHQSFLNPDFSIHRYSHNLLPNIKEAANLIADAVDNGKVIGIFGDYDADGIPGTALLFKALKKIGAKVKVYIPTREDGYGLSYAGIEKLAKDQVSLLVAIDNGTSAVDEVNYAISLKMNVIVLDHHEPHQVLPCAVIVNPKLSSSNYPFKEICATTIVYKFLEALAEKFTALSEGWLKWQLDLVAIATVCDIVPMIDENRVFAYYGIEVMRKSRNCGIRALAKVGGINLGDVTSYEIGYVLGPRINASGRVSENTEDVFRLLTTDDKELAVNIAEKLDKRNIRRQHNLEVAILNAEKQIISDKMLEHRVIVICDEAWGIGVVGLVAARMMEKYHRPVFCFCVEKGLCKGSARSLPGFELPNLLANVATLLDKWGGHNYAAGLALKKENFHSFRDQLQKITKNYPAEASEEDLLLETQISVSEINDKMFCALQRLQPYGIGNPKPLFYLNKINLQGVLNMGKDGKHLRGVIKQNGKSISFIGFGLCEYVKNMDLNGRFEAAVALRLNNWLGRSEIQVDIKDIRNVE